MASAALSQATPHEAIGSHALPTFRSPFRARTPGRPLDGAAIVLGRAHPVLALGQDQSTELATSTRRSVVVSRPSMRRVFGSKKLRIVTPGFGGCPRPNLVDNMTPKAPMRPPALQTEGAEFEVSEGNTVRNLQADLNSISHLVSPLVTGAPHIVTPSPMSIVTPTAPYKPDAHKPVTNSVSKPSASRKTSAFLTTTSAPATRSSSSLPKQPLASAGKRKSPEKSQPSSTVKSASASLPSPQQPKQSKRRIFADSDRQ
mmetsp:Transcript_45343/g.106401  ORF Transcript_45343/g.106401 Transcript_45343/m.106401 type:complete len:258 (-) Transcript_45343:230-1003(-)